MTLVALRDPEGLRDLQGLTGFGAKMVTSPGPVQPIGKYNPFAIASFALGLVGMVFPVIALIYLVTKNGGAGTLQSLFCGIPFPFASLLTGIAALLQIRRKGQPGKTKGAWTAVLGIALGLLFIVIFSSMLTILFLPYLMGNAG